MGGERYLRGDYHRTELRENLGEFEAAEAPAAELIELSNLPEPSTTTPLPVTDDRRCGNGDAAQDLGAISWNCDIQGSLSGHAWMKRVFGQLVEIGQLTDL